MPTSAGTQTSTRQQVFLSRLPGPARRTARQLFSLAVEHKLTPETVLSDVKERCNWLLFTPGGYRNAANVKRVLNALQADPEGAADFAREVLFTATGGRN